MIDKDNSATDDDDEPDGPLSEEESDRDAESPWSGLVIPNSFARSLLPGLDAATRSITASITAPWRDQMTGFLGATMPTFNIPMPAMLLHLSGAFQVTTQQWSKNILGDLRKSIGPILVPEVLRGFQRNLLPPNLRDHVDEVSARQIYDFLQEEGIPLYLVPRGATAVRLLSAHDHQARRRVLSDRYESLIEDCEAVLERSDDPAVRDEVLFSLDGVGAMRAGHTRSAQALFTVTLDTLIYRFYPDQKTRKNITNRKEGANVPDLIDSMGVHQAFVWLPIWNAHQEFWKHKGEQVPHNYSRHASVHGVSKRQFSKRNSIQSLLLVTSLIGYANRLLTQNSSR